MLGNVLYDFLVGHLPVAELLVRFCRIPRLQIHLVGALMAEGFQFVVVPELPGRDRCGYDHRFVEEAGGEAMRLTTINDRLAQGCFFLGSAEFCLGLPGQDYCMRGGGGAGWAEGGEDISRSGEWLIKVDIPLPMADLAFTEILAHYSSFKTSTTSSNVYAPSASILSRLNTMK